MIIETYDKGDVLRVTGTWTNAAGAAVDPTVVKFSYTTPAGVTTTLTYGIDIAVVKSATGVYYVDLDLDTEGTWKYRAYSTGTGKAADESTCIVTSEF
jgi:hypothetical protein